MYDLVMFNESTMKFSLFFKKTHKEISPQFNCSLKILRSDKYVQYALQDYCISHNIIHQTLCAHTAQQNNVAERKSRHLLDIARTLMVHMHVPKCF